MPALMLELLHVSFHAPWAQGSDGLCDIILLLAGWKFRGDGTCAGIPQLPASQSAALNYPRCCQSLSIRPDFFAGRESHHADLQGLSVALCLLGA